MQDWKESLKQIKKQLQKGAPPRKLRKRRTPSRKSKTKKTFSSEKQAKIKEQQNLAALAEGYAHGYFNKQMKLQTTRPLVFELYNCENVIARISALRRYDMDLLISKKKPDKVKKIEMKYCYKLKDQDRVKIAIAIEQTLRDKKLKPAEIVKDRYQIDDNALNQYRRQKQLIEIILHEGEIIRGTIVWFGKFNIKLKLETKAAVVIFKHAIYSHQVLKTQS